MGQRNGSEDVRPEGGGGSRGGGERVTELERNIQQKMAARTFHGQEWMDEEQLIHQINKQNG